MSKPVIFFLQVVATLLSLSLALLGLETLFENRIGWFLLVMGISYPAGSAIYYFIHKEPFWDSKGSGEPVLAEAKDRSFWVILPGFLTVFFLPPLEWYYLRPILPRSIVFEIAGWILIGAAVVLLAWARRHLREFYSGRVSVGSRHELIQTGPYHFIRHPSYAGMLLLGLGVSIGYASMMGILAAFVLLLPGLIYRISVEDRLLGKRFGEEFRQFQHSTKRLIPFVW